MARIKDHPQLLTWLKERNHDAILEFSDHQPRALSFLTALTYDQDSLVAWRAVEAVGLAAGRIAERDPGLVRNHLRRLLWSLNDESGAIGWRAAETIGEILSNCPGRFEEFVPIILSLLHMEAEEDAAYFRPGVFWAIGRIAQVSPDMGRNVRSKANDYLQDEDPQTRGMALWCLSRVKSPGPIPGITTLLKDNQRFEIYEKGEIRQVRISEVARDLAHRSF